MTIELHTWNTPNGRKISVALEEMGLSYTRLKMYDEAIAVFLKERAHGDDSDLEDALAYAYQAKGMTQQAQEAKDKAEKLKTKK